MDQLTPTHVLYLDQLFAKTLNIHIAIFV